MSTVAFTRAALQRLVRDRTALFFLVVLPVLVILLIGITVRNTDRVRVAVVLRDRGPLATDLDARLHRSPALVVRRIDALSTAKVALRREEVAAVVVVPPGFDAALRGGGRTTVTVLTTGRDNAGLTAETAVGSVVGQQAALVQAASFAGAHSPIGFAAAWDRASRLQSATAGVGTRVDLVDTTSRRLPSGYSYSAPTMLVLFVFINALAGAAALISARRTGLYARALAAPVTAATVVRGETLALIVLALLQSTLIVGVGAVVFGVDWGDPLAAVLLVVTWALLAAAVGLLGGTVFRTPEQASAIGPAVGIGLGMLGGCMWPLEIVAPVMRTIGHLTPQAWAVDAWSTLLSNRGGVLDIGTDLVVLGGAAAAVLGLAVARLRRQLVPA
ncbi:MAG: ABC transporter permease [Jatrophihabitans sp.]|uniref:ABC transporter permease n=1 Tax=Jatrophihabitans sp. TaxID=1932789 RepID=UPI003F7D6E45